MLRSRCLPRAAALLAAGALALTGCGGGEERVALAIEDVAWGDATHLYLYTECAEIDEVAIDRELDPVEVSLWGAPQVGTCEDRVVVKVDEGTTKITDGATSAVVDLPEYVPGDGSGHHGG
jgi:hypothetical protein